MHSIFHPASVQAHEVARLFWWMVAVGGAVWAIVVVAMLVFVMRGQPAAPAADSFEATPARRDRARRGVELSAVVTVIVLVGFLAFDFAVGRASAAHPSPALTIDVTGHQWWWEVHYESPDPSKIITTANEIHVPVGLPVQFKLRAADVIHSFWVPNLGGKRDMIPGYTSSIYFQADTPGVYRGQCAEFCGLQHAKMALYIVADSASAYKAWMALLSAPQSPPTDSAAAYGQRVFMSAGCPVCHTIGGTDARGTVGPSLSHLKSRRTIAAGALANNTASLLGWIVNPAAIKPGTRMPPSSLNAVQLQALVTYLGTLE